MFAQISDAHKNAYFDRLKIKAIDLASKPYQESLSSQLPNFLNELTYAEYHQIHFRRDKSVWLHDPVRFQVQFFHPGFIFRMPVHVKLIENGTIKEFGFDPALFE